MKEWITGRNPVYEVLKAGRRQVFRLLVARGVEEKGRLMEIISLAARRKAVVERVPRQQLDSLASGVESHQGVALEVSGFPYSFLSDIRRLLPIPRKSLSSSIWNSPSVNSIFLISRPLRAGTTVLI